MDTLYLSNDLTGCSELCSLFLHPDYRQGNHGKLLSKTTAFGPVRPAACRA